MPESAMPYRLQIDESLFDGADLYATRIFRLAVADEGVDGISKEMFSFDGYRLWNAAVSLLFFADGCYLCNRAIEDMARMGSGGQGKRDS